MTDRKLYLSLAALALVVIAADLLYFNQVAIAEPASEPAAEMAAASEATAAAPAAETAAAETPAPRADAAPTPPPATSSECSYDPGMQVVEDPTSLITIADPYLGDLNAPVKVIEFFDPNCGHCRTMHPIMKRVVESTSDKATFYMVPFVLWQHSLNQVEALYVAAQEDKYFEMLDAQYARQKPAGLSDDEIADIATSIGMDGAVVKQRVERALNRQSILERRQMITELGVRGTPTIMINGRFVESSSKTTACLTEMIEAAYEAEAG